LRVGKNGRFLEKKKKRGGESWGRVRTEKERGHRGRKGEKGRKAPKQHGKKTLISKPEGKTIFLPPSKKKKRGKSSNQEKNGRRDLILGGQGVHYCSPGG